MLYKWRRLCQYLPSTTPPQLYRLGKADNDTTASGSQAFGQWRLRVGSRHFRVARNLLYPDGPGTALRITSEPLELVGAEGIGVLWADRGWIRRSTSSVFSQGRINLTRFDWASAGLIREWIGMITGAHGQLMPNPRFPEAPLLIFDHEATYRLMWILADTWMAQAQCLKKRFYLKETELMSQGRLRESIAAGQVNDQGATAPPTKRNSKRRGLPVVVPPLGHDPLIA